MDPLVPNQVRYRAALHSAVRNIISDGGAKCQPGLQETRLTIQSGSQLVRDAARHAFGNFRLFRFHHHADERLGA